MHRVHIGFACAALLTSLPFLGYAPVAFVIIYAVVLCVGLPLVLLCRRRGWLQWWHAAIAGVVGASVCLPFRPEPSAIVYCFVMGQVLALTTWWIGLFRNPAFPSVRSRPPWEMFLLLPILVLGPLNYFDHAHDTRVRASSEAYSTVTP